MYTFSGTLLSENPTEKFKQLLWRPRPETLLSKEEQKQVRKNLPEYSKEFEEEDRYEVEMANTAVVTERMRLLDEWQYWVDLEKESVKTEREALGLPDPAEELELSRVKSEKGEESKVVEELVEEILEETEEIVS